MIGTPVPPFERATVGDLMRPGILSCHADAELTEVADIMATHRVHAVVVNGMPDPARGDDGEASGLICDRDLVRAIAENATRAPRERSRVNDVLELPGRHTPAQRLSRARARRSFRSPH